MFKSNLKLCDEMVMTCRLRGMFNLLARGDYVKLKDVVNENLMLLRVYGYMDMGAEKTNKFIDIMFMILVDLAFKRYNAVNDEIEYGRSIIYAPCTIMA